MQIRYMGSKRRIAAPIQARILARRPTLLVEPFGGRGIVSAGVADKIPIHYSDNAAWLCQIAEHFFTGTQAAGPLLTNEFKRKLAESVATGRDVHDKGLRTETAALASSDWRDLASTMDATPHVGRDQTAAQIALTARLGATDYKHALAATYYAGSYFSLTQAIEIDALRSAIEHAGSKQHHVAWLITISKTVNSPGHTAQALRAHNEKSAARVRQNFSRSIIDVFTDTIRELKPYGTPEWRARNRVSHLDAIEAIGLSDDRTTIYADPPYTKDQYSRFYHVLETLNKYDYPDSVGVGRYPSNRHTSRFSLKSKSVSAIEEIAAAASSTGATLLLSYPEPNLPGLTVEQLRDLLKRHYANVSAHSTSARFSTLGASRGQHDRPSIEVLYDCDSPV